MKNTKLDIHDIEFWWDKRSFIRTISICVLVYGAMMLWIERVTPPDGYVFKRLPPISGVWQCCKGSGKYGRSSVGDIQVTCGTPSYYGPLSGGFDCGMAKVPPGQIAVVTKVMYPTWDGWGEYVSRIESNGYVYLSDDMDDSIREKWKKGSRMDTWDAFVYVFIVAYSVQLASRKALWGKDGSTWVQSA